jgi:RNA polymerase primary sigma factor
MMRSEEDLIGLYMRRIADEALLTPEQEIDLAGRIKGGCDKSRDRMIRANLRLVVKIAAQYSGRGLSLADLVCEGNVGLVKAVERFEPGHGAKFSTYASWWIKQSVRRALATQCGPVRLPEHLSDKLALVTKLAARMAAELGRDPTNEELAAEVGISADKVERLRRAVTRSVSLDAPLGNDAASSHSLGEVFEDETTRSPFEELRDKNLRQHVLRLLLALNARERRVIGLRFGLDDGVERTLEEVGQEFGCTRENVRLIQAAALRKMRACMADLESPGAKPVAAAP